MSTWMQWFLFVFGLGIIIYVVRDFYNQRKIQKDFLSDILNSEDVLHESLEKIQQNFEKTTENNINVDSVNSDAGDSNNEFDSSSEDVEERAEADVEKIPNKAAEIISLSVMAREKDGISGVDLINELTSAHLYHGKFNAFHRTINDDGTGEILFSVVSATEPGFFDIMKMREQSFAGVTLFFEVKDADTSLHSLEILVKTAKQLSFRLNGELVDRQHRPMNKATLENYKQKIQTIS